MLHQAGVQVYLPDGENIRSGRNRDLGFSTQDRHGNIRRVAGIVLLMVDPV